MGIEDHIRDIIRDKVNERVGQEMSVVKHEACTYINTRIKEEIKKRPQYVLHPRRAGIGVLQEFCDNRTESSCLNAGDSWEREEDERLDKEMECAITWMSTLHSRSKGGIRARLRKHAEDADCRPFV